VLSLWFVMLLAGLGFPALTTAFHDRCYRDGGTTQGTLRWSAVPPGYVCTWTSAQNGFDARRGPGPWPSVYLAVMAASGLALVKWRPPSSEKVRASIFEPEVDPT
jgi:hypothetical protein